MALSDVRALVCDVFGTIVDWRGSVIRAGEALGRSRGLTVDWPAFADEWRRDGYHDAIRRIVAGEEPYVSSDELFRRKLAELAPGTGCRRSRRPTSTICCTSGGGSTRGRTRWPG